MRGLKIWAVVAITVTAVAAVPKEHYRALDKLPDWSGAWVLERPPSDANAPKPEQPKLRGSYLARYLAWQQELRDNHGVARRDTSNCMPPGMPNMMGTGQYPVEFLFTPGRVTLHHEAWMQWRTIHTDGRKQPDDTEPGIFGYSTGHWENGALIVETIGIKPITELGPGMKHSANLKITERFQLDPKDPDLMALEMTLEDSDALEAPYHRRHVYRRHRDWELMEFVCAENDRNPVDADGHTTFH
jgi:hypothetical protein